MSLENLANYWTTLDQTFFLYMFKTFLNPMILFLVLVGVLTLLNDKQPANIYLMSWFIASAIPFTLSDLVLQSRIMYNLPISILAAYGVSTLLTPLKNTIDPRRYARLKSAIIIAIVLTGLNYALRLIFEVLSYYVPI